MRLMLQERTIRAPVERGLIIRQLHQPVIILKNRGRCGSENGDSRLAFELVSFSAKGPRVWPGRSSRLQVYDNCTLRAPPRQAISLLNERGSLIFSRYSDLRHTDAMCICVLSWEGDQTRFWLTTGNMAA
jgi:hypothetical protein